MRPHYTKLWINRKIIIIDYSIHAFGRKQLKSIFCTKPQINRTIIGYFIFIKVFFMNQS